MSLRRGVLQCEFYQELRQGFSRWCRIPSSSVTRALALLDPSNPCRHENLEILKAALSVVWSLLPGPFDEAADVSQWRRRMREPWRYGGRMHEWDGMSFDLQKHFAKRISRLRKDVRGEDDAREVLSYFAPISDEALERAVQRVSIDRRRFVLQLEAELRRDQPKISMERLGRGEYVVHLSSSVRAELDIGGRGLTYSVVGQQDSGSARITYEHAFAIGPAEWDQMEAGHESEYATELAGMWRFLAEAYAQGPQSDVTS